MRTRLALAAALLLCGCALQNAVIKSNALAYSEVIEQTVDKMTLTNILEGRDNAPLHFVEFPKINASVFVSTSLQSSIPFLGTTIGNGGNSALAGTVTPNITVQSSPNFEVDNFAAKDFVTGMSSPIDPKFIKYWIDRGLNKRLILLMFFSSMQIIHTEDNGIGTRIRHSITLRNNPRQAADQIADCMAKAQISEDLFHPGGQWDDCHARTQFEDYLRLANTLADFFTSNAYIDLTMLTQSKGDLLPKDAAAIDPNRFRIKSRLVRNGNDAYAEYTLYSASADPRIALCLGDLEVLQGLQPSRATDGDVCFSPEVTHNAAPPPQDTEAPPSANRAPLAANASQDLAPPPPARPLELLFPPSWASSPVCDGEYRMHYPNALSFCSEYLDFADRFTRRNLAADGTVMLGDYAVKLSLRSVAEMIRFLGDLEYLQEQMERAYAKYAIQKPDIHHNIPITIGFDAQCHANDEQLTKAELGKLPCALPDNGFLFRLNGDPMGENAEVRFTLDYRGRSYSVVQGDRRDHTLEVLSIINQLVNLNKSAADIRPTPVFQLAP
jgi:hypothetical protein